MEDDMKQETNSTVLAIGVVVVVAIAAFVAIMLPSLFKNAPQTVVTTTTVTTTTVANPLTAQPSGGAARPPAMPG